MKESFRHFEHKKVDLIGLGNAIVDIIVNIEDEFLEINNLDKGSMNLVNSNESQRLLENCKVIKQISGGSSANTVVSLAELGNHVQFIGRVKIDQFAASSIDIKLICFTKTTKYIEWMKVKDLLALEIKNIVEKNNASFAFPSTSVYVEKN